MSQIQLFLFGTPRIEIDEQSIVIPRRKAVALVAFLAMAERPQSRATVAALLWPELDDKGARNALRSALPQLTQLCATEWLLIDRSTIALKPEAVWCDVQEFLHATIQVRLHADADLCAACVQQLQGAVALYQDEFLAGFSVAESIDFDNWQTSRREWLHQEYTQALRQLGTYYTTADLDMALKYARYWLQADALSEAAHRLAMKLYAMHGQRTEALRQYEECVRALDEELATLPEDETTRLYELIRSGNSLALPGDQAAVYVLPPLPALIIGREGVLTDLKQQLGIPHEHQKQPITVVEGWPGVGKSTLVAALAHDPDVWAAYPDGVMWTSLGENPSLQTELMRWGEALHVVAAGTIPPLEVLSSQIAAALRNRRLLLIVDDVWQVEHVTPFRVAGQHGAMVISSRLSAVARALAPTATDVYRLPQLTDDAALLLLGRLAPQVVVQFREAARELVADLEGLPLAIQVAGRLLHEEMQMGWGVEHLLAELRGARLLQEQAPSDLQGQVTSSTPTIATVLHRSILSLTEEALTRFSLLSLFAPKPATFDLKAIAALWGADDPRPTVRVLVNRGLLEPVAGGRFQIHALLVLHARMLLAKPD